MSKIEEALERANKLRGADAEKNGNIKDAFKNIEPQEINNKIVGVSQAGSPIAEEFRRLKSLLIRETKEDFLNTIMVTSSVDGEGKSTVAVNLAVSLAQELDHTVLLVDADLRRPTIHEYLGINYEYGLSDYLMQDIDISKILIKTGIGNLVFLPAGSTVENPTELLSSNKMQVLMKELKQRYMDRYILFDTPPILSFAEGISMASYVDGILFVVKERRAQRNMVKDALNMMKELNVLGVVYNDADEVDYEGPYFQYYKKK